MKEMYLLDFIAKSGVFKKHIIRRDLLPVEFEV